jgi:nucleoside-diphosphate-sugar epimerase
MTQVLIVTGGFGALGRALVAHLAGAGHRVAAVDVAPAPSDHGAAIALGGVDLAEEVPVAAAYKSGAVTGACLPLSLAG